MTEVQLLYIVPKHVNCLEVDLWNLQKAWKLNSADYQDSTQFCNRFNSNWLSALHISAILQEQSFYGRNDKFASYF